MPYDLSDFPSGTGLGGDSGCEDCDAVVVDETFDPCNAVILDADDVIFGYLRCDAVFTRDDGAGGRIPVDETNPNPEDIIAFTDLITSGELIMRNTENFDKPVAEPIDLDISSYKPSRTVKFTQNFTWTDTRRLPAATEAKLMNQILQWSKQGILHSLYVTKHDDVFFYREQTNLNGAHSQSPALESIETYTFNASVVMPDNALVVAVRIAGLFDALKALAL